MTSSADAIVKINNTVNLNDIDTKTPIMSATLLPIATSNIVRTRKGCTVLGGRQWYYKVKPEKHVETTGWNNSLKYVSKSLFEVYTYEECLNKFIVCNNVIHNGNPIRLFSLFNTPTEFFYYQSDIQDNLNKTFLEIMFGDKPQKQHFDIDITADMMEKFGLSAKYIAVLKDTEEFDKQQHLRLLNVIPSYLPNVYTRREVDTKQYDIASVADRKSPLTLQSPRGIVTATQITIEKETPEVRPSTSLIKEATIVYDKIIEDILFVILQAIIDEYRCRDVELTLTNNFAIYTSHSVYKRSYHIIIDGYYHHNNKACKVVYESIAKRLKKDIAKLIDHMVYSSFQQFRLLGSQKPQSCRPKIVVSSLPAIFTKILKSNIPGVIDEEPTLSRTVNLTKSLTPNSIAEFTRSVITNIDGCKLVDVPEASTTKKTFINTNDLTEKQIERAYQLAAKIGVDDISFSIDKVSGGMIMLKRRAPSFCLECKRTHNAENPYIVVNNNAVYYCCRRTEVKSFIGNLIGDNATEAEIDALENPSVDDEPIFGLGDNKLTFGSDGQQILIKVADEKTKIPSAVALPPEVCIATSVPTLLPISDIIVADTNISQMPSLLHSPVTSRPVVIKKFKGVEVAVVTSTKDTMIMNTSDSTKIYSRLPKQRLL